MRRMARGSEVHFLGARFRTDPGVFHPLVFASSRVFAEHLAGRAEKETRGLHMLDMGTGSGVIAVTLAARGAEVTACDVNPRAVALARENALLNGLTIQVHESDLFAAVSGRQFDLIAFNIPFYKTDPTTHYEAAFRAGRGFETVHRFAQGAREHLAPGGRVIIVFSEDCHHEETLAAFTAVGFSLEYERTTSRAFERFFVASFQHPVPV